MNRSAIGRRNRQKGQEFERQCVNFLKDKGIPAERIKGSGAQAEGHKDISIQAPHGEMIGECKWRADGFKQIYGWLEGGSFLAIKANRKKPLIVLTQDTFAEMIGRMK